MPRKLLLLALAAASACRSPEALMPRPPVPARTRPGPSELPFRIDVASGVLAPEVPEELRKALEEELKPWGAQPADRTRGPGPVLQVRLEKLGERPVIPPFTYLGIPGIASTGIGAALISSSAGVDVFPIGAVIGAGMAGVGIAGIAVGAAVGGVQARHNRRRGYPLLPFKAEVTLNLGRAEDGSTFQETYHTRSLQSATRPLTVEQRQAPGAVRREMLRALAGEIRTDLARHYEWTVEVRAGSR